MIIEGIVTTRDRTGAVNIAPMGARVADAARGAAPRTLTLRPYRSSQTFRNLSESSGGVFHVTDDVELIARAAVGDVAPETRLMEIAGQPCPILADACRWYAFVVDGTDVLREPAEMQCRVTASGRIRDFAGLNRAMLAVVEAAILATRVDFQDMHDWRRRLRELKVLVDKTGGAQQRRAFQFLESYLARRLDTSLDSATFLRD